MIKVLGIDAGIITGYCFIEIDEQGTWTPSKDWHTVSVLESGDLQSVDLDELGRFIPVFRRSKTHRVVIEQPLKSSPFGTIADELDFVTSRLHRVFPNATYVTAANWKPTRFGQMIVPPELRSQHQKDAYRMAVWYAIDRASRLTDTGKVR